MYNNITKLRDKAKQLYREYEAILVFTYGVTVDIKRKMTHTKDIISNSNSSKFLRRFIKDVKEKIANLRQCYGCKVPNSELIKILENAGKGGTELQLLIPKYTIKTLFTHFKKCLPAFETFPEHARIGIDSGTFRKHHGTIEVYLLETILFENMCALFNLAKEQHSKINKLTDSKRFIKTRNALNQATVTQAFYFVEAYLNGLSFNYYINKTDLDDKTKMFLTEWNHIHNKPKYLSLRDKILQYPRIILDTQYPPLQESNCPEIDFITDRAKIIRDAIVHASPFLNLHTFEPEKERKVFELTFEEVEQVVDNAITLVQKIETSIYGDTKRLSWLHKRGPNGLFPETVFD
ncbi:MAG TPA: hypothetical protein ACFYD6_13405 [Candidatus Brocadiia bacterium]|nr:hypothetical protein [Candidatus Brocadiales bacterium]